MGAAATQGLSERTINARFGGLALTFGVLIPAGRRYRRRLGLSVAEQYVIEQLLYHYDWNGIWRSFGQNLLAKELGVSRPTVSGQLQQLRKKGLVATRPDPRFGTRAKTLRYCLDPYLAVLAMWQGHDRFSPEVWTEGNERLLRFARAVDWGKWVWEVDGLRTPPSPMAKVLWSFLDKYGVLLLAPPTPIAVPVSRFLADERAPASVEAKPGLTKRLTGLVPGGERALSVPPTEVDSHIHTSIQVKALVPKELETLVHEQLKTSELRTLDNQLATLVGHPLAPTQRERGSVA